MTRAQPLAREDRRQAIVEAALPLVMEHGRDLSTRQIAEAAGLAEGTLFRAFGTKTEIVDATIAAGLAPHVLTDALRAIAPTASLPDLIVAIVSVLIEHAHRTHRLLALLPADEHAHHGPDRHQAHREMGERTLAAIAEVLAPHTDALALRPPDCAGPILALSFGATFASSSPDPRRITDVILHGIAAHEGH